MDSLEKLNGLITGSREIVPEDEEQAKLIQTIQLAGPFLGDFIPPTSEELDYLLLGLVGWAVDLRSDDADPAPAIEALTTAIEVVEDRAAAARAEGSDATE